MLPIQAANYFMYHFKNSTADGKVIIWPAQVSVGCKRSRCSSVVLLRACHWDYARAWVCLYISGFMFAYACGPVPLSARLRIGDVLLSDMSVITGARVVLVHVEPWQHLLAVLPR